MGIKFSPGCPCCHQYLLALRWIFGNTETTLFKLSVNGTIMSGVFGNQFQLHDQQPNAAWATDAGLESDNSNGFLVFTPQHQGLPSGPSPNQHESQAFHDAINAPGIQNFSVIGWPNTATYSATLYGIDPTTGGGLRWKILGKATKTPLSSPDFSFTINSDGTIT